MPYLIQATAAAEEKVNECLLNATWIRMLWAILYSTYDDPL